MFLRVVVQEGGATDTYNFFFKVNAGDAWTQIPGVAVNYQTAFANSRVGLTYKTGAAKSGAAFTYFNVQDASTLPPQITTHPQNLTAVQGGAARFTVTATGAASYQWRRGTVNISPGGTNAEYVLDPAGAADNGAVFDCIVTNSCGAAASNPLALTVCESDFNCDSVSDFFDYLDFVAAFSANDPEADFNHDEVIDFFDYLDFVAAFSAGC